jgi:hypothetical protein
VSHLAAVKCGLSSLQSKVSYTSGRVAATLARPAVATLGVLESFEGPKNPDTLLAGLVGVEALGWLVGWRQRPFRSTQAAAAPAWLASGVEQLREREFRDKQQAALQEGRKLFDRSDQARAEAARLRSAALLALGVLKLVQVASGSVATGLARLSRPPGGAIEQCFFFANTSQVPARLWPSRLSPLLNRLDHGPARLEASEGLMVEVNGRTWHRGVVVVKTALGERTISHLQSLTLPAAHYYFNRRLADHETVGIIAGQKGFEPKYLDGYVGRISELEMLAPAWARLKGNLIRTQLYWGQVAAGGETPVPMPEKEGPATDKGATKSNRPPRLAQAPYPLQQVGDRVRLDGREYPVIIRRVRPAADRRPLAEAAYYDEAAQVWKEVVDEEARQWLARQVKSGRMQAWES